MTLTPAEQEAVELRKRGLSQRAIALATGVSRTTVKDRLANADRKLKDTERKDAA